VDNHRRPFYKFCHQCPYWGTVLIENKAGAPKGAKPGCTSPWLLAAKTDRWRKPIEVLSETHNGLRWARCVLTNDEGGF